MNRLKVLVVEDEVIIAWDLKRQVELFGHEVVSIVSSADGAVEAARRYAPDLILMDIALKGVKTGIAAAGEIRLFSQVPIIYLTGNDHLQGDPAVIATKAQGIYGKPVSVGQLGEMIEIARVAMA